MQPLALNTPLTAEFFVARVTDASAAPLYQFVERWVVAGTAADKAGGRSGNALNPARALTGLTLVANDIFLCRRSEGEGGTRYEAIAKLPGNTGTVTVSGSGVDNAVARFDGTGTTVIQSSLTTIDDNGNIATGTLGGGSYIIGDGLANEGAFALWGAPGYLDTDPYPGLNSANTAMVLLDQVRSGVVLLCETVYVVDPSEVATYTGQTGAIAPGATAHAGIVTSLGSGSFGDAVLSGTQTFTAANTFAPTADVVPVTIRGSAAQTANLLTVEENGGTDVFTVDKDGDVTGASFTGVGTGLTGLNASELGSGTIPSARIGTVDAGTW